MMRGSCQTLSNWDYIATNRALSIVSVNQFCSTTYKIDILCEVVPNLDYWVKTVVIHSILIHQLTETHHYHIDVLKVSHTIQSVALCSYETDFFYTRNIYRLRNIELLVDMF